MTTFMEDQLNTTNMTLCELYGFGRSFDFAWYQTLLLLVSVFGILGNLLNLFILTRYQMVHHLDQAARSGLYGLVVLAVSDMCFCLAQLPEGIFPSDYMWYSWPRRHILHSKIYGEALRETFMGCSAWVISIISVYRLIMVICPQGAKHIMTARRTGISLFLVFALCLLITLPSYFHLEILPCVTASLIHGVELSKGFGGGDSWQKWLYYRMRVAPALVTFVPFTIMAVSNLWLLFILRSPPDMPSQEAARTSTSNNNITAVLVAVVVMFAVLVLPIEILLYRDIFSYHQWGHLVDKIFNILKALNFASNFVLYVMVNAKFRLVLLATLPWRSKENHHDSTTNISEVGATCI